MIIQEIYNNLIHTYSDNKLKIQQIETGIIYDEAIDKIPCPYTYAETNIAIIAEEE